MGYMDEREYEFSMERFTGIDQAMEDNDTPMHVSRNAQNCDTWGGVLKLACGWATDDIPPLVVNENHQNIRTLMYFHRTSSDGAMSTKLLAATDNAVYLLEGSSWRPIQGANPVTSGRFSWVNFQKGDASMIIIANGSDNVYSWTGSGDLVKLAADAPLTEGYPVADKETNVIRLTNHGLLKGQTVVFYAEKGKLPDGISAYDTYFVKEAGTDTFKIGTSKSGTGITDIRGPGSKGWRVARANWLGIPTANAGADLITVTSHGLCQNEVVVFDPWDGSLPGGIAANTAYYSYINDANSFYVTTSQDCYEDRVNITSAGSNFRVRKHIQSAWLSGAPAANAGTDIILFTGHGLKDKAPIQFEYADGGSMPAGLTKHDNTDNGKFYYVVKATPNTFKVADKPGGTPINMTSAGSKLRVRPSRENRPMGGSLALHAERVWCAGEKSRPNSAFFSDDKNPSNWTVGVESAGEMVKATWDGDAVTAVANLFDSVVVFKSKSMFRISGTTPGDYQVTPILSTTGTVSPATICQWQNAAFFLSPQGIMAYDGMSCQRLGGDAMKDFWARMNTDRIPLSGACAAVHGGKLLMALPVDGSMANNCVIEFNVAASMFMVRTGVQVDCWLPGDVLRFATGSQVCIWGKDAGGNEVQTYGGSPIAMRWETPETDFGSRSALKTVTCFVVTGLGGPLDITVKADGRICKKRLVLPACQGDVKVNFNVSGKHISFALDNVQGSNIAISGVTVLYEREEG